MSYLQRDEDKSESGLPPAVPATEPVDVSTSTEEVDVEAARATQFGRASVEGGTATRTEAQLVSRCLAHLRGLGHTVRSMRMRPPGEYHWLRADLVDTTRDELCEAKGVTIRNSVRLAIGQLLDYNRFVGADRLAVLLPTRPSADLLALMRSLGVACVHEGSGGSFERVDPE